MGRINIILSFIRTLRNGAKVSDVKCDPGGGANTTAEHFSSPGDDSFPLTTDVALTVPRNGSGREAVVGYIDPSSEQKAEAGDKRIYARDSAGDEVAEVWLENDGTITLENDEADITISPDGTITNTVGSLSFTLTPAGTATLTNGSGTFAMSASGDVNINGVIITAAGLITAPGITGTLDLHTHPQAPDSASDTQVPTGPPL